MPKQAKLDDIIDMLWNHSENAEWTPKIEVIPGALFRQWMSSEDIEVLGFVYSNLGDRRFRIEPQLSLDEYLGFVRHYYERCFVENPDGEWSDSRYSAGWDLVNVLAFQWENSDLPESTMAEWKSWLAEIYKRGSEEVRTCIVNATLEHLLEKGAFRKFFADWVQDPVLRKPYEEALLWYEGGGRRPLGKSPSIQPLVRSRLGKSRFRRK
jgi:hypothetical protein